MEQKDLIKMLGAFPSTWDIRNYRVRNATPLDVELLPENYVGLDEYLPKPPIAPEYPFQGNIGQCFPTETPVLMEDFSYKPIGQIEVGEYVITPEGNKKRVTQKFKRKWQGNTRLIKIYGIPNIIECTNEHPFLTIKGWKQADELTKDDFVAIPLNKIIEDKTLYSIENDPDFLWLLGLYLAEGSIYDKGYCYRIQFSLSIKENDIAERIQLIMSKYNISVHIQERIEDNGLIVRFSSKYWCNIFKEFGGKYAEYKQLNSRLMFLEPELQYKIFEGWSDGDGCYKEKENNTVVVTVSENLAWQMYHILLRNNIRGSIQRRRDRDDRLPVWVLDISWNERTATTSARGFFQDKFFYSRVRENTKHIYMRENVYNLEVEDDNTYIIYSIAVHNCVGADGMIVKETQNYLIDGEFDDLSMAWLYQMSRNYSEPPIQDWQGEGSTNQGLVKAMNKVGATLRIHCPEDIESPFEFKHDEDAYKVASKYTIDSYWNVNPNPNDVKSAIYGLTHPMPYTMPDGSVGKTPLISAFPVYDSFYDSFKNGGVVPLPKPTDKLLGGHSSPLTGWMSKYGLTDYLISKGVKTKIVEEYVIHSGYLTNMGSWNNDVGDEGFFYLPENYPFYPYDFYLIHIGEATVDPEPDTPSDCIVAKSYVKFGNICANIFNRKTRIPTPIVPKIY